MASPVDSAPAAQPTVTFTLGGEPVAPQAIVEALARVLLSARRRRQEPRAVAAVEETQGEFHG